MASFTRNYSDQNTNRGYQYEFFCDRCGQGIKSTQIPGSKGIIKKTIGKAADLIEDILITTTEISGKYNDRRPPENAEEALKRAIKEVRQHFKHCKRCGNWVCLDHCWSKEWNLCNDCAPYEEENDTPHDNKPTPTVLPSEITVPTKQTETPEIPMAFPDYSEPDLYDPNYIQPELETKPSLPPDHCPLCKTEFKQLWKFCPTCGVDMSMYKSCSNCHKTIPVIIKTCPSCGAAQ